MPKPSVVGERAVGRLAGERGTERQRSIGVAEALVAARFVVEFEAEVQVDGDRGSNDRFGWKSHEVIRLTS